MRRTTLLPLSLLFHFAIALSCDAQIVWNRTLPDYRGSVYSIVADPARGVFAGTDSGIYRSTNNGDTWTLLGSSLFDAPVVAIAIASGGSIFAGTDSGIYRSTDNGTTWSRVNRGLTNTRVSSIAVTPQGTLIAGTDRSGVYRSTDNGENWSQQGPDGAPVSVLMTGPGGLLFAGTTVANVSGLFRSSDDGITWTPARNGLKAGNLFALARNSRGTLFTAAFNHVPTVPGIHRSSDSGNTWTGIGLENTWLTSLAIDSRDHIFVGSKGGGYSDLPTHFGVSRSSDNGENWVPENLGLTNRNVLSLAITSGDFIFAGTEGGLFRSEGATFSANGNSESRLRERVIGTIHPNPFSTRTTVRLLLPNSSQVQIDIYDALGRIVTTLRSGMVHAGMHDIVWNAEDIERGVYFCRITADNSVNVRKLMVIP